MSNEKCPFVVGEVYKTRDGSDAECLALRPDGIVGQKVVFEIQDMDGECLLYTRKDGRIGEDGDHPCDILPPTPKLVERWVAVYCVQQGSYASPALYDAEDQARAAQPTAHSYHKIMVPE